MATVRGGLIQMSLKAPTDKSPQEIAKGMMEAHAPLIEKAGKAGVQVLCLQEVFNQPYFCPSQDPKWYAAAEPVPEGPTVKVMQDFARRFAMAIVVPLYEEAMTGVYYNTAAVIDADGAYLGKYRKTHIPRSQASGRSSSSSPAPQTIPFSTSAIASSASTSATTAISPKAGGRWR